MLAAPALIYLVANSDAFLCFVANKLVFLVHVLLCFET
jgi:hypothetical protein